MAEGSSNVLYVRWFSVDDVLAQGTNSVRRSYSLEQDQPADGYRIYFLTTGLVARSPIYHARPR